MLLATGSGLLLSCACIGYAGSARAEASATDVAAARSLGQEGIALANQGKCKEAIELFERAEKILHAPTHLFRLAECMVKMGRLVEGTEVLNRLVRETLAANAPAAFKSAQERGQALLARTQPRLAKLRINVAGPGRDVALTVTIDGRSVSSATIGVSQPADPGERTVEVSAPGFLPKSAKVTLTEAGAGEVSLSLEPDPNAEKVPAVAATPAVSDAPVKPPPPPEATTAVRWPGYLALGVGAVGLGAGAVFGLVAMSKRSDLDQDCREKVCPVGTESRLSSFRTSADVSTVFFVVGGVAAVAGVTLLIFAPQRRTTVGLSLGPRSASVQGTF